MMRALNMQQDGREQDAVECMNHFFELMPNDGQEAMTEIWIDFSRGFNR